MYESVKRKEATSPAVLPQWSVPALVESLPKPTEIVQRALTAHTFRPMTAQRRAAQPVFQASQSEQAEVQRLATEQRAIQRQLDTLPPLPIGALSAALQRQQTPASPPLKPQSPAEWVTVMRFQAEQAEGRLMDVHQAGQFTALQRQVAQVLQQGYRQDRQPPAVRQAHYAEHLVALQRHPASGQVARAVMALIPAGERPALQRAVDEALQRQALQDAQDQAALTQQTLQRKKTELEAEGLQPVLQRIQARRGAGNPLPAAIQRHLEQGLNHDLSRVRIHDDAEADKLTKKVNALAFTTGTDIYFRSGHFNPNSQSGLELLGHEVTHTVQQSKGNVGAGVDPDAGLESEARQMGQKLATLPVKQAPNPHAPGVYTHSAALKRVQTGAAHALSLKPLTDLQPTSLQRLGNPLTWVADQAKSGLASALTRIPGYRELTMAFGRDLVTGKTMAANPNAILDALAGWVPGPLKDVLKALKETGAIPKAWAWFKAELGKLDLGGALGEVGKAMGKADLGAAKSAITRRISGLKALIVGSAHKIAEIGLTALTAGLGPVGQQVIAKLRSSGGLILQVLKNPAKFASHLLGALKGGFSRFAQNAPKHLQNGLGQWLTGASGIAFPAKLDLQGVFLTSLSVMGLTYQAMRGRLVKSLGANGEKQVRQAEGTLDTLRTLKGGMHKASEMKANQGAISSEVTSNLKTEVTKSVVTAGITKVATMLIPGGGFVNALIGAFRSVQFLVQQGQQIMGVVTSAIASVSAIAAGNIGAAISGVESTLARSIPVALGFLGKVLGLGNLGAKIKAVINKVRGKLDGVLDKVIGRLKTAVAQVTGKTQTGTPPADHTRDTPASRAVKANVRTYLSGRLPQQGTANDIKTVLKQAMERFKPQGLKSLRTQALRRGRYQIQASASPYENVGLTDTKIMFNADDLELMTLRRGVALRASINGIEIQTTNTPGKKGELPKHAEENFVQNAERVLKRFKGQTSDVIVQLSSSPCGDPGCDADLQKKLHNCASTLIAFAESSSIRLRVQMLGLYSPKVKGGKALSKDGIRRMLEHGIRVETWSPEQAIAQLEAEMGPLDPAVVKSIQSKLRNIIKELEALSGLNLR
ncbi:eCIS core domain-containing protein [Deinococcus puniceus]|uniref:eCIS core domain-containing protein n=1 Tax=Deinococcus puniceus TaxID=1182568 RepID=UPI0007C9248A|nr:DUF4157 domain-containing protein [Deinococcus puniceus]